MAMDAKKYREFLHHSRSHPLSHSSGSSEESYKHLYFSIPAFLILEFYLEHKAESLPQGIAFPFGFLLFWAFYYTYQRPGHLESKLKSPQRWQTSSIPTVILKATIWFVKVTIVELVENIILQWILGQKSEEQKQPAHQTASHTQSNSQRVAKPSEENLPREIENALLLLGLKGCRDWSLIHKRYRELAKKFHPDLNPDLTSAGNRFMIYDGAYRRLHLVKNKYFKDPSKK
jgi:hypothetical protein